MALNLKILDLACSYGTAKVLDGLTFSFEKGSFTGIIGPNGSGKSTLLRCISRVLKPTGGAVLLDDRDLYELNPREVAQKMAVVPQETAVNFSFTVEEIIMMGRSPHLGRFQTESEKDFALVNRVMELTNTRHLACRPITAISGGERQRVIVAKALAQEPEIILLDEPTSHLDINHQVEILNLLRRLNREENATVVVVFHDLNLAAQYCDSLLLMQKGRIYILGKPEKVLTADNIKEVYGTSVLIRKHPVTGRPAVMLLARGFQSALAEGKRVHVVCGGGAGASLLEQLANCGYVVTAGVLNIGDVDWETARSLELTTAEEDPFSSITGRSHQENLELIKNADACIMASIPFGSGNIKNLEAVSLALTWGKPVLLMEEEKIQERDYTGGQAVLLYNELKSKGAVVTQDEAAILETLPLLIP
ncbi:MAG: heme ABC transporter ATP-binding protein [Desulfotomaculaceae bacterium]|nr:heme ABC transporter ATP-binding protein [Desulfotomaculaceae bacterium]